MSYCDHMLYTRSLRLAPECPAFRLVCIYSAACVVYHVQAYRKVDCSSRPCAHYLRLCMTRYVLSLCILCLLSYSHTLILGSPCDWRSYLSVGPMSSKATLRWGHTCAHMPMLSNETHCLHTLAYTHSGLHRFVESLQKEGVSFQSTQQGAAVPTSTVSPQACTTCYM